MSQRQNGHRPKRKTVSQSTTRQQVNNNLKTKPGASIGKQIPSIPTSLRTITKQAGDVITYVFDTNVLMEDASSVYRFKEHNIYIPETVLEELDRNKKGDREENRQVRTVSRLFDELIRGNRGLKASEGFLLPGGGRLFLGDDMFPQKPVKALNTNKPDNKIINTCLALAQQNKPVVLVSKDILCRVKAFKAGVNAEDYLHETATSSGDDEQVRTGVHELPDSFWEEVESSLKIEHIEGRNQYTFSHTYLKGVLNNEFLIIGEKFTLQITRKLSSQRVIAREMSVYVNKPSAWRVSPRTLRQAIALELLLDPNVDFVSLLGKTGSGKTLLTLAAGLAQTFDSNRYREIIFSRLTVPVGEDIGFLPGTEEEKMHPRMGALMDNLEVLTNTEFGEWGRSATADLIRKRISIRSLNFMRGRTFLSKFIVLDEAQNLTPKQTKTLITRAGPGTKVVLLGNTAQIDTPYLSEHTNGLVYVIKRLGGNYSRLGHVTLDSVERSLLSAVAEEYL